MVLVNTCALVQHNNIKSCDDNYKLSSGDVVCYIELRSTNGISSKSVEKLYIRHKVCVLFLSSDLFFFLKV